MERFSVDSGFEGEWRAQRVEDGRAKFSGRSGEAHSDLALPGAHNLSNALAAVAAAYASGVSIERACTALATFVPPARRLQLLGRYPEGSSSIALYDDFAHHPTAIQATLEALVDDYRRVLAVFEPASNSMRSGAHLAGLPQALEGAAHTWLTPPASLAWDPRAQFADVAHVTPCADANEAARAVAAAAGPGDVIVFMSNSGASGCADLIAEALSGRVASHSANRP